MPFVEDEYIIKHPDVLLGRKVLYYGKVFIVKEVYVDGTLWIVTEEKDSQAQVKEVGNEADNQRN